MPPCLQAQMSTDKGDYHPTETVAVTVVLTNCGTEPADVHQTRAIDGSCIHEVDRTHVGVIAPQASLTLEGSFTAPDCEATVRILDRFRVGGLAAAVAEATVEVLWLT